MNIKKSRSPDINACASQINENFVTYSVHGDTVVV